MYHGKYSTAKPVRRAKRKKSPSLLLISLVLLLCVAIGGSVAFLIDFTDQVENTFTPAEVEVKIEESFDGQIKNNVFIHNDSNVKVYVRVTLVENWENAAGEMIPPAAQPAFAWGAWKTEENPNWFEVNGIYYYKIPLDAGSDQYTSDDTSQLIEQVTVTLPEGYTYHLDILAEAIQAEPKTAVEEAWVDVDVDDDGNLKHHMAG